MACVRHDAGRGGCERADCGRCSLGRGAGSPPGASPNAPPVIVKLLTYDIELGKDGLATDTIHVRLLANNGAAAQQIGQQPVPYSESMSDADIVDAYTLKADGRKLPVDTAAIYTQPVPGTPQLPMFDDQRQKVVVFPQVEAGDSVDLTYRLHDKQPYLPGEFSRFLPFSRLVPYDDVEITIVVPKDVTLNVETHEMDFEKRSQGDTVSYLWHYAAPTPLAEYTGALSELDTSPRIYASTLKDYDAFARLYARLAAPKEAVTAKIQATADQITAGVSDRREQARLIYEWVSRHIRYVGVEIGVGAIVPHDADTVLANGYGDCKDHVALFASLLKAKGIEGDFVLINSGNSYALPAIAVVGQLNHAITWLPEFGLYADTTAGVAPFGALPFDEYGKPVIRVTPSGPAVAQVPILAAGAATSATATTAKIDAQGVLSAQTTVSATGAYSVALRAVGLAIQGAGPDRALSAALAAQDLGGTGNFSIPPPDDLKPDYSLSGNYTLSADPNLLSGKRFGMPAALAVLGVPGEGLMGPLLDKKIGDGEPTACFNGRQSEDVSLDAPDGRIFESPPPDTDIETAHIKYVVHWTVAGGHLTLHREFTSTMATALCTGEVRKEAAKALAQIRDSYEYGVAIAPPGSTAAFPAEDAGRAGGEALRQGQFAQAVRQFTIVLATPGLPPRQQAAAHAVRGTAYALEGEYQSGLDDMVQSLHLDSTFAPAAASVARLLSEHREFARAETLWSSVIEAVPASAAFYESRGIVRDALLREADAQADFTKAIALASDSQAVATYYADRADSHWSSQEWPDAISDFSSAIVYNAD